MGFNFELASILFEVEYRKIKVLRITVYPPDGRVRIAAPPAATQDAVKNFAAAKIEWVKKQRERFLNRSKSSGTLRNDSTVYFWGAALKLELIERVGHPKIIIESGYMKMYVRPNSTKAKRQEFLDKWYLNNVKEAAPPIIKKWEAVLGLKVKKLYVRKMKTHWGSCNYERQTLRLNSELAKRRIECLEYVIVHEMLHIFDSGHGKNYYRLLNKYMPDWKTIRKGMNRGEL